MAHLELVVSRERGEKSLVPTFLRKITLNVVGKRGRMDAVLLNTFSALNNEQKELMENYAEGKMEFPKYLSKLTDNINAQKATLSAMGLGREGSGDAEKHR